MSYDPPTEWVRPADWPAVPTLAAEQFSGLFAVYNNDTNFVALSAAGAYTVDWGDGSATENIATGVTAYHSFSYAGALGALTTRGYKTAWVNVTPQAGQTLSTINLQIKHNRATLPAAPAAQWLDIALQGTNITTLTIGGATVNVLMLERAVLGTLGAVTSFASLFSGCSSLQFVAISSSASVTNFTSMFGNCKSLHQAPMFDTAAGTTFSSMFSGCSSLQIVPLYDTSAGTTFSTMFGTCTSLRTVPLLNTALGTTFASMFTGCAALQSVPLFNTSSGTTFSSMFSSCASLQTVPLFDTALVTVFSNMFNGCTSLETVPAFNVISSTANISTFSSASNVKSIAFVNISISLAVTNLSLARAQLVEIFNNLATVAGKTLTVTGNHGVVDLSAGDQAIATGKGWTLVL
jgi:hypothetical protein